MILALPTLQPNSNSAKAPSSSPLTTHLTGSLISGLVTNRQSQLQRLTEQISAQNSKVLLSVLVKDQQPLTETQRQQLPATLFSKHRHLPFPQNLTGLTANKPLLLTQLEVNNRIQWAVGTEKLAIGSRLRVQPHNPQQWHIMPTPQKRSLSPLLQQSLRENLPKAQELGPMLQELRAATIERGVPRSLVQAINRAIDLTTSPPQLSTSKGFKQALKQSGSLWESTLAKSVAGVSLNSTGSLSPTSPADDNRHGQASTLEKIFRSIVATNTTKQSIAAQSWQKQTNHNHTAPQWSRPNTQASPTLPLAEREPVQNLKAQLLIIKQIAQSLLAPSKALLSGGSQNTIQPTLMQQKTSLMAQQSAVKNASSDKADSDVIKRIQQTAVAALAKIQVQQSQSLLQQQQANEGRGPFNQLQLDIPVLIDNDFHQLRVQIEEEWVEREINEQEREKTRRWRVTLCIELPKGGQFFACISHTEDETEIQLWAEQQAMVSQIQTQLDTLQSRLREQGVQVKSLSCDLGTPTQPNNEYHCALVDVRT